MDLLTRFEKSLADYELICANDGVLVGVSGGLDSTVLLDLLVRIRARLNLKLHIVHVHHGLRGQEADEDLDFVRSLAKRYQVPFSSRNVEAAVTAAEENRSLEEAARVLRYQVFDELLDRTGLAKVATAHTADDQAETVLDRLLRGSGLSGLAGIPRVRQRYVRPLLDFTRNELQAYATRNEVRFREDSSNLDLRFRRNRIRRKLIPILKEDYNPNLTRTLNRTAGICRENEAFLQDFAKNAFNSLVFLDKKNEITLDIQGFLNYFEIVQKYIVFQVCDKLSVARNHLNFEKIEVLLQLIRNRRIGKKVILDHEFEARIDHDGIVFRKSRTFAKQGAVNLLRQSRVEFNGYELRWSVVEKPGKLDFSADRNSEFVDFDLTGHRLKVRAAQPADRFVPLNLPGHKKVADYYSDRKIPHRDRELLPILESSDGIVWICGQCIDDRFKVTEHTRRIVRLEMFEKANGT